MNHLLDEAKTNIQKYYALLFIIIIYHYACSVAQYCRPKYNNFDVGRGWVQISVLVSPCITLSINCCIFTLLMYKIEKKLFIAQTATPLSDLAHLQQIRS